MAGPEADDPRRKQVVACMPALRRYAHSLERASPRAEDLLQDTLCLALAKLDLYRPTGSLTGWLCTIMRHLFIEDRRRRKRGRLDPVGDAIEWLGPGVGPEQETKLCAREVLARLGALPASHRHIIDMVVFQERSYDHVAGALGVPINTVRSRLFRARAALHRDVEGSDAEPRPPACVVVEADGLFTGRLEPGFARRLEICPDVRCAAARLAQRPDVLMLDLDVADTLALAATAARRKVALVLAAGQIDRDLLAQLPRLPSATLLRKPFTRGQLRIALAVAAKPAR